MSQTVPPRARVVALSVSHADDHVALVTGNGQLLLLNLAAAAAASEEASEAAAAAAAAAASAAAAVAHEGSTGATVAQDCGQLLQPGDCTDEPAVRTRAGCNGSHACTTSAPRARLHHVSIKTAPLMFLRAQGVTSAPRHARLPSRALRHRMPAWAPGRPCAAAFAAAVRSAWTHASTSLCCSSPATTGAAARSSCWGSHCGVRDGPLAM